MSWLGISLARTTRISWPTYFLVVARNSFADGVFQVVGLDDAVAGEGFVHQVGQLGVVFLHGAGGFADFAAVNHDRHDAHGKNHDGNQRQRGVGRQLVTTAGQRMVTGSLTAEANELPTMP